MSAFHDAAQYPFIAPLVEHWQDIRAEYLAVKQHMTEWHERKLFDGEWKVFGIFNFPHGETLVSAGLCPLTAKLLAKVPGHGAGGFSLLKGGTRIKPHMGYQGDFLRCHLGLIIPEGDCKLRVGKEERVWRDGEALVFDDRLQHEAWNLTDADRVVLLVDFVP